MSKLARGGGSAYGVADAAAAGRCFELLMRRISSNDVMWPSLQEVDLRRSIFVLFVRILFSLGVATNSRAAPSGVVPGCSGGGSSGLRLAGSSGLDRVSVVYLRVLFVISRDLVIISVSFESLYVTVCPPAG